MNYGTMHHALRLNFNSAASFNLIELVLEQIWGAACAVPEVECHVCHVCLVCSSMHVAEYKVLDEQCRIHNAEYQPWAHGPMGYLPMGPWPMSPCAHVPMGP